MGAHQDACPRVCLVKLAFTHRPSKATDSSLRPLSTNNIFQFLLLLLNHLLRSNLQMFISMMGPFGLGSERENAVPEEKEA